MVRISVLLGAILLAMPALVSAADITDKSAPTIHDVEIRLVNLTIPPDSPYRTKFTSTPRLYVRLFKDGVPIGPGGVFGARSSLIDGWEGDFDRSSADNIWTITIGGDSPYMVQVWDRNWFGSNQHIFTISNLRGADLLKTVSETVGSAAEPSSAARIYFREGK